MLGLNIVANWVLLANGIGCAVAIGGSKEILTNESLNVTGVARYLLVSYFVVGSVDPVLGVTTHIAEYNLVLVDGWHEVGAVEPAGLVDVPETVECDRVLSGVLEDLSLDLPSGGSETLVLGGHVARVPRQVLLVIV